MPAISYDKNVFINCPFDTDYQPLLDAVEEEKGDRRSLFFFAPQPSAEKAMEKSDVPGVGL